MACKTSRPAGAPPALAAEAAMTQHRGPDVGAVTAVHAYRNVVGDALETGIGYPGPVVDRYHAGSGMSACAVAAVPPPRPVSATATIWVEPS